MLTDVIGLRNKYLITITSDYLVWVEDTRSALIIIQNKFEEMKESRVVLDGDFIEPIRSTHWDSFVTFDQLFEIFPIEFLEQWNMNMVRNWKLKKLMDE
jgi:hypothetical protein